MESSLRTVVHLGDVGYVPQGVLHLYLLDDGAEGVGYDQDHDGEADDEDDAGGKNVLDILRESYSEEVRERLGTSPCRCRRSRRRRSCPLPPS